MNPNATRTARRIRFARGALLGCLALIQAGAQEPAGRATLVDQVLEATAPLRHPRGDRLPLYLWPLMDFPAASEEELDRILRAFQARGFAAISSWNYGRKEATLAESLRRARKQRTLGLEVNINANDCLHQFFNGDPATAHVSDAGEPFFDSSFASNVKMGCPFAVAFRIPAIREQMEYFARGFQEAGESIDFIFADWEIDGPIEWNRAWESSKRCRRCKENISRIDDFAEFQRALRIIRSELQKKAFAEVILSRFPKALAGNYAVYPHQGYRYWYDYFEKPVEGAPFKADQRARYRPWFQEFPLTGYTCAMPVVYTWYPIFQWYDFPHPDYRWFYNLLLTASNAGQSADSSIPIVSFVHWHTTAPPPNPDPNVRQFSAEAYQELLWHMLLRGVDAFFLWCPANETVPEVALLHAVFGESLAHGEMLSQGKVITFAVPSEAGPVISGLRWKETLLIRRTDFDGDSEPVTLSMDGRELKVPRASGRNQVIQWKAP